jgi:homoserine O-acetyltransferase
MIGHGRGVDTQTFQVLGIDYLGSSGGSTGPERADERFATISTFDQAAALLAVLDALGVKRLHAIVGASYGGMVALAFAERYPERVDRLVVTSAGERTHPLSTAWRSVQREIVRFGIRHHDSAGGLKLARALAMATYRSGREFAERFAGEPGRDAEGVVRFPVESYLHARGEDYAARHFPAAFLCLSESIDLHHIQASAISTPTTLIAITEDQLVPLADLHSLAAGLPCATLHVVSSPFGHDAFLKERNLLGPLFSQALHAPVSLTP